MSDPARLNGHAPVELAGDTAPLVGVVVVNWNRKDDTLRCLDALRAVTYPNVAVVLIDNASTDDSVDAIRMAHPDLPILALPDNTGFTGGHNAGMRYFLERDAAYVLLLNNDAVIAPDAITLLVEAAQAHPAAGLVGANICVLEAPETVLSAGGTLDDGWRVRHEGMGLLRDQMPLAPYTTAFLSGCAVMASRSTLQQIGLLDDDFFLYFEDVEWSYRARQRGYDLLLVPQAIVWHPDTRRRDVASKRITYYAARNALLFARKHNLGWRARVAVWVYHVRMALSWSVRPRWRGKRAQRDALLLAFRDYLSGRFGRNDTV